MVRVDRGFGGDSGGHLHGSFDGSIWPEVGDRRLRSDAVLPRLGLHHRRQSRLGT